MYIVKKGENEVSLSAEQLTNLLIEQVPQSNKDFGKIAEAFLEGTMLNGSLKSLSASNICEISIALGYYLRIFYEKNNVRTETGTTEEDADNDSGSDC